MERQNKWKQFPKHNNKSNNHAWFLPDEILCIICGRSGSGKTALMIDLLLTDGILNYKDISIYATSKSQSAYTYLKEYCDNIDATLRNLGHENQTYTFMDVMK